MLKNTCVFVSFMLAISMMAVSIPSPTQARPVPQSFADLVEKLSPAVVNISTSMKPQKITHGPNPFEGHPFFEEFFGENFMQEFPMHIQPSASLGSGVIISADGYIVTNNHVVERADDIVIKMNNDEREYVAKLVGADPKNDIALLKIDAEKLPAVHFADSDAVRVGDWTLAIGNPFGLGGTVTAGIISGRGRQIGQGPYDDFLQTDTAINPGNSGGPLFNMAGDVVGINTAIFTRSGGSQGVGFAIPANTVELVVRQLKEHGRPVRGWLGVRIQEMTKPLAEVLDLTAKQGALVAGVVSGSPADKGGLKEGDLIIRFDGKTVKSMKDLPKMVAETKVGKRVHVDILREGNEVRLGVMIDELDEKEETNRISRMDSDEGIEDIAGMLLAPLDEASRDALGIDMGMKGVLVEAVLRESRAWLSGLRAGDVLLSVNRIKVATVADVKQALAGRDDENTLMLLMRSGEKSFIALKGEPKE